MSVKVKYLNNGDMVVSKETNTIFVILVISILIYTNQDMVVPFFTKLIFILANKELRISTYILVLLISIFFYRIVTLSSNFYFSNSEKNLNYKIQYWFSNKRGTISINAIQGAFVESHDVNEARIVLNTKEEKIPMSDISRKSSHDTSMVIKINDWLKENKNT